MTFPKGNCHIKKEKKYRSKIDQIYFNIKNMFRHTHPDDDQWNNLLDCVESLEKNTIKAGEIVITKKGWEEGSPVTVGKKFNVDQVVG